MSICHKYICFCSPLAAQEKNNNRMTNMSFFSAAFYINVLKLLQFQRLYHLVSKSACCILHSRRAVEMGKVA